MKKILFLFASLLPMITFAKICSYGCEIPGSSTSTQTVVAGYGWEQPEGTKCGKSWLSNHPNTAVYEVQAVATPGIPGITITDQGWLEGSSMAC